MLSVANPIDLAAYKPPFYNGETVVPMDQAPTRVVNPVVPACEYAFKETNIVHISKDGVKKAAEYISLRMLVESYTPRAWRTHPLHICPPEPYSSSNPLIKDCLNWLFLIGSLNFSFWSEREEGQYGVEWRAGWETDKQVVHTGYWSLVAALNRALEENIPITDPAFYSSEMLCPDTLIAYVFRPAPGSKEHLPLLKERIGIMRQVGSILCDSFGGSYAGFLNTFQQARRGKGTALELALAITNTFPSFRDEQFIAGRRVFFWKRAQILVAETWAAFFPADSCAPHPLFPLTPGPCISSLTMFADYRVPQILHHLGILVYPASLQQKLRDRVYIPSGSSEELSLRAASVISVERVRDEILRLRGDTGSESLTEVNSVLIDFYLWDLAKRIEVGIDRIDGFETIEMLPAHRTRCIWY